MIKTIRKSLLLVMSLFAITSCVSDVYSDDSETTQLPKTKLTFKAESNADASTRTSLGDGNHVLWSRNDEIAILTEAPSGVIMDDSELNACFHLTGGSKSTHGSFEGETYLNDCFKAVYPYLKKYKRTGNVISGLTLANQQVATPNGFDPSVAFMTASVVAEPNKNGELELPLYFKNVCSFVKFTTTFDCDQITFRGRNSEKIAGGFSVTINDNGIGTPKATSGMSSVSLVPAGNSKTIKAGTYLIAILPQATMKKGFDISFSVKGIEYTQTIVTKVSKFVRNNVVNLGSYTLDDKWPNGEENGHEFISLGLSVKWASCNVGANNAYDRGKYYAWADPTGHTIGESWGFTWDDYYHCFDSYTPQLFKYVLMPSHATPKPFGTGEVDNIRVVESDDDAVRKEWGGKWRMPKYEELQELRENCYWEWTTNYKNSFVPGFVVYRVNADKDKGVTSFDSSIPSASYNVASDAHIFLPAYGYRDSGELHSDLKGAGIWTSTLNSANDTEAQSLYFEQKNITLGNTPRYRGLLLRPVCP